MAEPCPRSVPSSPGSAASTSASSAPAGTAPGKSRSIPTASACSLVIGQMSLGMEISRPLILNGSLRSTSSAAASPASPLASPAKDSPRPMPAGSGPSLLDSFAHYDPATSSWRTCQVCLGGDLETWSETWPRAGMTRSGIAYSRNTLVFPNIAKGYFLSPIPHHLVHRRYFIKTPSMLRAIDRGYMCPVETRPTLTTKIIERAPCPYWTTPWGPRYLTESEAERLMGYPIGWTVCAPSATPSSRKSRNTSGGA